jgi:hypothetical protein
MNGRSLKWFVVAMLLASFLLATASVAYAARDQKPKLEASCCFGFPPCDVIIDKCGWCCTGPVSKMGHIQIHYDVNCGATVTDTWCDWGTCGMFGCAP